MKRILLFVVLMLWFSAAWAQDRTVSGRVTSADDASGLPGVNVVVKGSAVGTVTDTEGNYTITAPSNGTLVFTFIGLQSQEIPVNDRSTIDVSMAQDVQQLSEVVVTALNVDREKASLGYATQEVSGDQVSAVKDMNFMNSLSGKVAGVQIKRSNQMGGSTNVVVRGYKSLAQNNQALFVVDGIIMSNDITNTADQRTGRGGYDYGNAAMDINPDDIESINILKSAAATALYGSRAANGAIIITTKKGKQRKGLGVTASFGTTFGKVDKSTYVKYQHEFGPGYGPYYLSDDGYYDVFDFGDGAGEQLITPAYEDASYGAPLDGTLAYDWRSVYPQLDSYGQLFPQVAPRNTALDFFETSRMMTTNIAVDGGTEKADYRLSYTRMDQNGILPNSNIDRNTVAFNAGYNVTERMRISSMVNFTLSEAVGRYGTGYDSRNPNQAFRQWWNVAVDMDDLRRAYEQTGLNLTWNPYASLDPERLSQPHYSDNPYFSRHQNFNSDERNRIFGNFMLDYKLTDWMTFTGRVATDRYDELREERIAVGSVDVPLYRRSNRNFSENNIDLFLNFDTEFGEDLSFTGLIGANYRRTKANAITAETNGGLVAPGLYSLSNSKNSPLAPAESAYQIATDGYFAQANLGWRDMLYLDLTYRYDIASTLPEGKNKYDYPSVSLAWVFSEVIPIDFLSLGKVRANWASVGNLAPQYYVNDIFNLNDPFGPVPLASADAIRRNPDLENENTQSWEVGLELGFFSDRLLLDASYYKSNTYEQIFTADVTAAAGRRTDIVNAGNIENRGVEVSLRGTPVKTADFTWNVNVNWTRYRNKVLELLDDMTNFQIFNAQGGITVNATVGEPYGSIRGTNFVYHTDGSPIVRPFAARAGMQYVTSGTPEVIGNINPDWLGGIQNVFSYKGVNLSFLIDMQRGGDFFSLDTWYGFATGLYDITAGTNKNGVSVRAHPDDGGGYYPEGKMMGVIQAGTDENGVPISDGTPNTTAFWAGDYANAIGYAVAPNAQHIYDASFVKHREVSLGYSLPSSIVSRTPFTGIDISLIGRNLWIIHKNSPYSDPEEGLSAGNALGNQSGAYPAVKEYGFNINVRL